MADSTCPQWCENNHSNDDTVIARRRLHIATVGRLDLPTGRAEVLIIATDRWSHGEWTPRRDPSVEVRYPDGKDILRDLTDLDPDQARALAGILDGTGTGQLVDYLRQAAATIESADR